MKTIMWCGDSTVRGAASSGGVYYQSLVTEEGVCTSLLLEKYGPGSVVSINAGEGGTTAADWCNGNASLGMPSFVNRIIANPTVDIFILQVGINDAFNAGMTDDAWRWCLGEIHRNITYAGKKLILATTAPINLEQNGRLWALMHILRDYASGAGVYVIDHYNLLANYCPGWSKGLPDNVHPNEALYRLKGHSAFFALIAHLTY